MKNQLLFVLIVNFIFHSCTNSSNKKKEIRVNEFEKVEKTKKSSASKSIDNQIRGKNAQFDTTSDFEGKKSKSLNTKPKNTDSISPKTITNISTNEKKEIYPIKWKNTYSKDKKWMELYDSSCSFFLNGWKNEFEINSSAQISKEELLLAYRKRMENIFYETPSFIEFCVQELEESPKFLAFCEQWKQNIK